MSISVLIADDQALVRAGFRRLLDGEPDVRVVAEAGDGAVAVTTASQTHADVALLDIRMPVMDGIEATRRIVAATDTRVIILTTFDLDQYVYDALRAGASGFLLKDSPPEHLMTAIRAVAEGDALIAPSITRRLIAEFSHRPTSDDAIRAVEPLTARERDVLRYLARGLSNAEIAAAVYLGEATIKTHVGSLLAKLGLRDRVQAVVYAYEHGLARPGTTPAEEQAAWVQKPPHRK
ncbi:MAG TPA: response regulator transcription factor [Mycobacteriales bacterium]